VYIVVCLFCLLLFSLLYTHTHTYTYTPIPRSSHEEKTKVTGKNCIFCSIHTYIHTLAPRERMVMVRRDGAEIRKERIQKVTKRVLSLLQKHDELSLSKTLAILEYETGLTKEKLMEYLAIGADTGHFVIDVENDKITKIRSKKVGEVHG